MMILVRALIANDNKGHEIYKMTGKIFSMGTPVEKIADYVESLITERLNSLGREGPIGLPEAAKG